jgi:hypothetical protein
MTVAEARLQFPIGELKRLFCFGKSVLHQQILTQRAVGHRDKPIARWQLRPGPLDCAPKVSFTFR